MHSLRKQRAGRSSAWLFGVPRLGVPPGRVVVTPCILSLQHQNKHEQTRVVPFEMICQSNPDHSVPKNRNNHSAIKPYNGLRLCTKNDPTHYVVTIRYISIPLPFNQRNVESSFISLTGSPQEILKHRVVDHEAYGLSFRDFRDRSHCGKPLRMQALLPCKLLLGLSNWNTIPAPNRCTSMRAASHWTWFAVLAALSRKARH
jgi:hypothetical protein